MERKKTQATTAKLKKVQTEIKKTKDKLNKLMAEEESLQAKMESQILKRCGSFCRALILLS